MPPLLKRNRLSVAIFLLLTVTLLTSACGSEDLSEEDQYLASLETYTFPYSAAVTLSNNAWNEYLETIESGILGIVSFDQAKAARAEVLKLERASEALVAILPIGTPPEKCKPRRDALLAESRLKLEFARLQLAFIDGIGGVGGLGGLGFDGEAMTRDVDSVLQQLASNRAVTDAAHSDC